jgi:hypothetical protein
MRGRRLEKKRRIRWNTLRSFSGRERRRRPQIVCRSRMALLGQAPKMQNHRGVRLLPSFSDVTTMTGSVDA